MTGATSTARLLVAARCLRARRAKQRPSSPAELAKRLDPKFVITPTIALLSDLAVRSVTEPDQRDIVTTPPRTGKSRLLAIWTVVWALQRDPDMEIVLVSYSDDLAQTHSREALKIITEHAGYLGFALSRDKTSTANWRIDGRKGGLLAVGIGAGITGHGAQLLVIDDVVKNAGEADSAAQRTRVINEYRNTLATRVEPGGSTLLVMTRWHEADLAGELLRSQPGTWRHTNIPAIAEAGIPDALHRSPGAAMTSAIGFTLAHYAGKRVSSGERTWYAMFQGVPSSPLGGLIKQDWLDQWRLPAAPSHPLRVVIGVDPADSGERDAAGVVAASVTADGTVAVIADVSALMTSEQWAQAAVSLAIDLGAAEIAVEAFSSGTTYVRVVKEALARRNPGRFIQVSPWPPKGTPRRGDAVARSATLLQALEVGTCRIAGHLPALEEAAVHWQAGQHQPDSVAALVIAHDRLAQVAGHQIAFGAPGRAGLHDRREVPEYLTRSISGRPNLDTLADAVTAPPSRLKRKISGARGYDPLAGPRKTIRGIGW